MQSNTGRAMCLWSPVGTLTSHCNMLLQLLQHVTMKQRAELDCVAVLLQSTLDALLAEEAALAKEIEEEEKQRQAQLAAMREKIQSGGSSLHDEL